MRSLVSPNDLPTMLVGSAVTTLIAVATAIVLVLPMALVFGKAALIAAASAVAVAFVALGVTGVLFLVAFVKER
jgi:hypothetical protein